MPLPTMQILSERFSDAMNDNEVIRGDIVETFILYMRYNFLLKACYQT
jgi:hypothetical protein